MRGPQDGECGCGGRIEFRQRRDFQLHTVLAGQDVDVWIQYGQCESCRKGWFPLLSEMRVDREGFTQSLQELSALAGVMEPYGPASEELLGRFTGVKVSSEKIQSMVRLDLSEHRSLGPILGFQSGMKGKWLPAAAARARTLHDEVIG